MKKIITTILSALAVLPLSFAFINNDVETIKTSAEMAPRSHTGQFLTNPMAIQGNTNAIYNAINILYGLTNGYVPGQTNPEFARTMYPYVALADRDLNDFNTTIESADLEGSTEDWVGNLNIADDESEPIMLTFEGTNDISKAVTGMIAMVYDDPDSGYHEQPFTHSIHATNGFNDVDYNDVTFYPVGCYNCTKDAYFPIADFNADSGGAYVYLYWTNDSRLGLPISNVSLVYRQTTQYSQHTSSYVNKYTYSDYEACDFDHGVESNSEMEYPYCHVYMHFFHYLYSITSTMPFEDAKLTCYTSYSSVNDTYAPKGSNKYPGYNVEYRNRSNQLFGVDTWSFTDPIFTGSYALNDGATSAQQVAFFTNELMRMNESSFVGTGTGVCATKGYYDYAKNGVTNQLNATGRVALYQILNDPTKANTNEYKALERMIAWARYNGEEFSITSTGNVSYASSNSNLSVVNDTNNIGLVIVLLALALTTFIGFFISKKKVAN